MQFDIKNRTNQECPLFFGNTTAISITLHSCYVKYFQNTDFIDAKPYSSRSKMTKADWFSVFSLKNVKSLFPKQMQSILLSFLDGKDGH